MRFLTSGRFAAATSVLALVVAMGGTGYAAVKVKGNQIASNAITSPKVKNDSLTGQDLKESTLTVVPSATNAQTAADAGQVDGFNFAKVYYRGNTDNPQVVFAGGGLTITANCVSGLTKLTARTSKQSSSIFSHLIDVEAATVFGNDAESGDFTTVTDYNLLGQANASNIDPAIVTFEYDALDGTVVTGTLSTDTDPSDTASCGVAGTVMQG